MISNHFSPDPLVLIYAAVSVVLCLLIYQAGRFSRFDWHSEKMNQVLGSARIHQVDINSGDPARNAAVAAANVTHSMSAANGASLLVLALFLFGTFAGSVAIPAALGMMTSITTLNLLALMLAGLAWGLGLGRLTMSLIRFGFKLAVWTALIVALLFVVNFTFSFLNGGKDLFWDSAASKVVAVKDSLYNYDNAPKGSWFSNYEAHRKQNLCALYEGIKSQGNMADTRRECDPDAFAADRRAIEQEQNQAQKKLEREQEAVTKAYLNALKRLNGGIKDALVPDFAQTPIGTWTGLANCSGKHVSYKISFAGEPSNLRGVVQILPQGQQFAGGSEFSVYRFTASQDGLNIAVHASDWIQEGSSGKKRDWQLKLVSKRHSMLIADTVSDGCTGMSFHGLTKLLQND